MTASPTTCRIAARVAALLLAALLIQPAAAQDGRPLDIGAALPLAGETMQNVTGSGSRWGRRGSP